MKDSSRRGSTSRPGEGGFKNGVQTSKIKVYWRKRKQLREKGNQEFKMRLQEGVKTSITRVPWRESQLLRARGTSVVERISKSTLPLRRMSESQRWGRLEEGCMTLSGNGTTMWELEPRSHRHLEEGIRISRGIFRRESKPRNEESSRRESEPRRQGHLEEGIWMSLSSSITICTVPVPRPCSTWLIGLRPKQRVSDS